MMTKDPEKEGSYFFDASKVREYIAPSLENCDLKPYVAGANLAKSEKITEWDYIKIMESTWGPEAKDMFEKYQAASKVASKRSPKYFGL